MIYIMDALPKIYTNSNPIIKNTIIHLGSSLFLNLGFNNKNNSEILDLLKPFFQCENNSNNYKLIIQQKSNYIKLLVFYTKHQ